MAYTVSGNKIYIDDVHFHAGQILGSGQLFLFEPYSDGHILWAGEHACIIYADEGGRHVLECTDTQYFVNFFDLDTDYADIYRRLVSAGGIMESAAKFGSGIRILNQPVVPTIFSFIVSANNNIKRISAILKRMCVQFGYRRSFAGTEYYTFPTAEALAVSGGSDIFRELGLGYRAPYIWRTACDIQSGVFDIDAPRNKDYGIALGELTKLMGVGRKVADCILLFAYGRRDVFPVDTWIEKVYRQYFMEDSQQLANRAAISCSLVQKFGDISGYAQQYLFYYQREYGKIY